MTRCGCIAACLMIAAVGCSRPDAPHDRILVDDLGRTITTAEHIHRVVTLAPSVTEVAFEAGAGDLVVGVTDADDYPLRVGTLPRIQALPVDLEAIVALRPDLVLASDEVNDPRDADRLAALGIPTYFVRVETLADVSRSIRGLGLVLGTNKIADVVADSLDVALEALYLDEQVGRTSVLVLVGDETLFSFGRGSYVHEMVEAAGARSVTADFEMRAPVLSEEWVIDAAPRIIIGAWGAGYDVARLLELHPSWAGVPAIRDGRVYAVDPDLVLRPGPRLVEGTKLFAWIIADTRGAGS